MASPEWLQYQVATRLGKDTKFKVFMMCKKEGRRDFSGKIRTNTSLESAENW